MRSVPPRPEGPDCFRMQLLFVGTCGERLVLDGLAEIRDQQGRIVGAPLSMALRRPHSSLVETLLVGLFGLYCEEARLIEVAVQNAMMARFSTAAGEFVLPVEDVTGLPRPPG